MKILYVTTISLTMNTFLKPHVAMLVDEGHQVDIACNDSGQGLDPFYIEKGCRFFSIGFSRSPLSQGNVNAYRQLRQVVEEGNYDIVHCHTPSASAITRLVCRKYRKRGLKVFYTAHGFHFYKGAPLKNWLIYYPIEKFCSRFTDTLITINHEDHELAEKKMKAKRVEYIPGVGIDVNKIRDTVVDRPKKRRELNVPGDAFLLLSVGELNENKNHQIVIRALAELQDPGIHYLIVGRGDLKVELEDLAKKLGVERQVHLAGFRSDVAELYKIAEIDVFPSLREGLGLAALEGMAAGLPLICADNRGTKEYARDGYNAVICANSAAEYASAIRTLRQDDEKRREYGDHGVIVSRQFDLQAAGDAMRKIYQ